MIEIPSFQGQSPVQSHPHSTKHAPNRPKYVWLPYGTMVSCGCLMQTGAAIIALRQTSSIIVILYIYKYISMMIIILL